MPPRNLVWYDAATEDVVDLLARRNDKEAVLGCIESNLLAVSNDPELTKQASSPLHERILRFQCADGDVELYFLAVFVYTPNREVALLRLTTQPL